MGRVPLSQLLPEQAPSQQMPDPRPEVGEEARAQKELRRQQGSTPSAQGSNLNDPSSKCSSPAARRTRGGSERRKRRTKPDWSCWLAAAARCLPLALLPLLLASRAAGAPASEPGAAAAGAGAWGSAAVLLCAQAAHLRGSWRLGIVLDALSLRLLHGECAP